MSQVAFVEGQNRLKVVKSFLEALGINPVKGKDVLIKPNLNTAEPSKKLNRPKGETPIWVV